MIRTEDSGSQFNPIVLERFCQEEQENSKCAKFVETYPRRLVALIAVIGASTKALNKGSEHLSKFAKKKKSFRKRFCFICRLMAKSIFNPFYIKSVNTNFANPL